MEIMNINVFMNPVTDKSHIKIYRNREELFMRKSRLKLALIMATATIMAIATTACADKQVVNVDSASNSGIATSGDAKQGDVLANDPIANFATNDSAKYTLILNEEQHDMTDYVVSYIDGTCMVKSSILVDFFGFTKSDRSNDQMVEYISKDGKILQLMIGSNDIIFDGADNKISGTIEKVEGIEDVTISMDFLLCIGEYNTYSTSVQNDALTFEPIADIPVDYSAELGTDANEELIESVIGDDMLDAVTEESEEMIVDDNNVDTENAEDETLEVIEETQTATVTE